MLSNSSQAVLITPHLLYTHGDSIFTPTFTRGPVRSHRRVQLDVRDIGDAAATKRFEGAHGHLGDVGFFSRRALQRGQHKGVMLTRLPRGCQERWIAPSPKKVGRSSQVNRCTTVVSVNGGNVHTSANDSIRRSGPLPCVGGHPWLLLGCLGCLPFRPWQPPQR